jgi:tRNA U34 2-thiouridine synthase MnmA/TrmU
MDVKNLRIPNRPHCVALFSGGLDSALAIILMLKQDIEVTALTFMTHFGCDLGDRSSCGGNPYPTAEKFGFNVKLMHLGQKFVDIVENPKYGRGKNMNVCVDCRILMLSEAREFMELINADFVVTGEVMGQRPMSQVKDKLYLTIKESGLKGKLLRPLSAKLLPPTEMELSGLVDREKLEGISGRGRTRQLELAKQFGLQDYPSPASGCLLTDVGYSNRLRDLMAHSGRLTFDDINLLRVGRHFRLDEQTKVIVGRNELDNNYLDAHKQKYHCRFEVMQAGSPVTLLIGNPSEENLSKAASLTARYSSLKDSDLVPVTITGPEGEKVMMVSPNVDEKNESLMPVR